MKTETAFNPLGLTPSQIGDGWELLSEGATLEPEDGFWHPDYKFWIAYECRPDMFRNTKEFVHTWPWRRKSTQESETQPA